MKYAYWEIRNVPGESVCQRATFADCRRMLDKYVTDPPKLPGWSSGPYEIWRVTEVRRLKHRPPQAKT